MSTLNGFLSFGALEALDRAGASPAQKLVALAALAGSWVREEDGRCFYRWRPSDLATRIRVAPTQIKAARSLLIRTGLMTSETPADNLAGKPEVVDLTPLYESTDHDPEKRKRGYLPWCLAPYLEAADLTPAQRLVTYFMLARARQNAADGKWIVVWSVDAAAKRLGINRHVVGATRQQLLESMGYCTQVGSPNKARRQATEVDVTDLVRLVERKTPAPTPRRPRSTTRRGARPATSAPAPVEMSREYDDTGDLGVDVGCLVPIAGESADTELSR